MRDPMFLHIRDKNLRIVGTFCFDLDNGIGYIGVAQVSRNDVGSRVLGREISFGRSNSKSAIPVVPSNAVKDSVDLIQDIFGPVICEIENRYADVGLEKTTTMKISNFVNDIVKELHGVDEVQVAGI